MNQRLEVQRNDQGDATVVHLTDVTDTIGDGEVEIAVAYSGINYKDALALSGSPGVIRTWPLVPGIDAVGKVISDATGQFAPGTLVTCNGSGIGERQHGGMTSRLRCPAIGTVPVPDGWAARQVAAVGTAGYTAALSWRAIIDGGVRPSDGPVVVTGATGGVGSVALMLGKALGYELHAVTGRVDEHQAKLVELGAAKVVDRADFSESGKPLQRAEYAGAVDCVGSVALANILARTNPEGIVTTCGLAMGPDLPTTVMPFILRGVSLIGINSVDVSYDKRQRAWDLIWDNLSPTALDSITDEVNLAGAKNVAKSLLKGTHSGRTVITVSEIT